MTLTVTERITCSVTCGKALADQDHIQEYTRAMAFHGLSDMVVKDAIREGDGEYVNIDWRLRMVDMHANKHTQYLPIACNMFAGKFLLKHVP